MKKRAKRISESPLLVGLDPVLIITILTTIIPLIVKWCKLHQNPEKIRAKAAQKLLEGSKPPQRIRRAMKRNGVTLEIEQDKMWTAILADTAASKDADIASDVANQDWNVIGEA